MEIPSVGGFFMPPRKKFVDRVSYFAGCFWTRHFCSFLSLRSAAPTAIIFIRKDATSLPDKNETTRDKGKSMSAELTNKMAMLNHATASYIRAFYTSVADHIENGTADQHPATSRYASWRPIKERAEFTVRIFRKWAAQLDAYETVLKPITEEEMLEQALIVIEHMGHKNIAIGDTYPINVDMCCHIAKRLEEIEVERMARKHRVRSIASYFANTLAFEKELVPLDDKYIQFITTKTCNLPTRFR